MVNFAKLINNSPLPLFNVQAHNAKNIVYMPDIPEETQKGSDLIYDLVQVPEWQPIPYITGGLYDRCISNFLENGNKPALPDDDENYEWYKIPHPSNIVSIRLQKPGKKVEETYEYNSYGKEYRKITGVVRLDIYLYASATHEFLQAFSFGDRNNIIKPFKILNHKWGIINKINKYNYWKCEECGLEGKSKISEFKPPIIPNQMLTCEEIKIKDILL
jgi:hypothetical protein